MRIAASLKINFDDETKASRIYAAILPEVRSTKPGVARVSMSLEGTSIRLEIGGSSLAAVRALLNSYIRWLSTSFEVMSLGG
ncbi:MAG: KEOPS complex subunit Pcc1 [Candidatus Verstraetearchaeota archaeon]|nr:KEOPS complex subunit Pcc1 [Candidatus Verstraetearchaeota archaeon]